MNGELPNVQTLHQSSVLIIHLLLNMVKLVNVQECGIVYKLTMLLVMLSLKLMLIKMVNSMPKITSNMIIYQSSSIIVIPMEMINLIVKNFSTVL